MNARRVDVLNIGLMLVSCGLAFALPFELFLFSYAVLGPLHYLTEISWLHHRGYFTERRFDYLPLVLLCGALMTIHYGLVGLDMAIWAPIISALALGTALAGALARSARARAGIIVASAMIGVGMADSASAHDLLRVFLPTLIHVWLFTGAFVLLGALRGRSPTGFASLAVFGACSLACFLVGASPGTPPTSGGYVFSSYESVLSVNVTLADWLGFPLTDYADAYGSAIGRSVARFIAFAYTYHYLNWFSKTSIIQWHKIPKAWTFANIGLWLASIALYAWDYAIGLGALFGLSYLHVYLELPLNHRTFVGIGQELGALVTGRASVAGRG